MLHKLRKLCLEDGFKLKRCMSSDIDLLKAIQNDFRKNGMKGKYLKLEIFTDDKWLDVKRDVKDYTLGFIVKVNDKSALRCVLLPYLSSMYDPTGLNAPFLLKEKQIIQSLSKQHLR